MLKSVKFKLTRTRYGRAALHLGCIFRGGRWRWHWEGVRRELTRKSFVCAGVFLLACHSLKAQPATNTYYSEPFRPQFHFSPEKNWMNDPNGLVFYDGEYHLFYQHNPFGNTWGHMSWGHAVSSDLVHWKHLPLALPEENGVMIFSGSAVVDWQNTSGFGTNGEPPLVAIYAGHYTGKPLQNQNLAYSNDRGRTWTKYSGNPVLDIGQKDFRDPKVFWHAPTHRWVMAVAWPQEHKVRFYSSPDLKAWEHLSDFGPAGATNGVWECPDLFPLTVEGTKHQKWVLIVNLNPGGPAGGSGTQYFVGEFDGQHFLLDGSDTTSKGANYGERQNCLWLDHGRDFYAAVTWSDIPRKDGRRIALGWMNNWDYAQSVPTAPWRSAMTVPRTLQLHRTSEGFRVFQNPVPEIDTLHKGKARVFSGGSFAQAIEWLQNQKDLSELMDFEIDLEKVSTGTPFSLALVTSDSETLILNCDPAKERISLNRTNAGQADFHEGFAGIQSAPMRVKDGKCSLRLLLDTCSLEVFAQQGETVMTDLFFPTGKTRRWALSASGEKSPVVRRIQIHSLESVWTASSKVIAQSPSVLSSRNWPIQ